MNERIAERIADFKERAKSMGLEHGKDYSLELVGPDEGESRIQVLTPDARLMTFYALMGLASHFVDRSWATGRTWTYIIKDRFGLTFTDLDTDHNG